MDRVSGIGAFRFDKRIAEEVAEGNVFARAVAPGLNLLRRAARKEPASTLPFKRPGAADGFLAGVEGVTGAASVQRTGSPAQPGRVRLRTLVLLRWLAVGGQAAALLVVYGVLGFRFPVGLAFLGVAVSAWLNIVLTALYPASRRLSDRAAAAFLAYDLGQLGVLLYFTGGLANPFALMFLAPAIISATILSLRATLVFVALTIVCGTVLAVWHEPLPWSPAGSFRLPPLYMAGLWAALTSGVLFLALYVWRIAAEARRMADALGATQMALAREQQLSALGGLAAAAAHELGTPLATLSVVVKELQNEAPPDSAFAEDLALLRSQTERCREILGTLARKPELEEGFPTATIPFPALVEQAALPHQAFGKEIVLDLREPDFEAPLVRRSPEVQHALGNLIENAVEFARTGARIEIAWDASELRVCIVDDGPGFPVPVMDMLGEPYFSRRSGGESGLSGKGLGLGVFIAKTLLERTGATVAFANAPEGGAVVEIAWPRAALAAEG